MSVKVHINVIETYLGDSASDLFPLRRAFIIDIARSPRAAAIIYVHISFHCFYTTNLHIKNNCCR